VAILVKCNATEVGSEALSFSSELPADESIQPAKGDEVFIWTSEHPRRGPDGQGLELRGNLISWQRSGLTAKVTVKIDDRLSEAHLGMDDLESAARESEPARRLHERIHKSRRPRIWGLDEDERALLDKVFNKQSAGRKKSLHRSAHQIAHPDFTAEDNIRAIIPEDNLIDVLRILSHSIRTANRFAPEKWGVRISRKNIMLKVGFVEVLQVYNDVFHHLVKGDLVPKVARNNRHYSFSPSPYKNAPACDTFETDLLISAKAYQQLLSAHEAAIEIAAQSPIHTTTKKDHSTDLVNFISRILGTRLPQPTYIEASEQTFLYPDEVADHETFFEGAATRVLVNRYERDRVARHKCIKHHGSNCGACDISFGDYYGPVMTGFIHVHHLAPLGSARKETNVDPIHDLRPVCPNCHAVIHSSNPPLTLDQVRSLIKKHAS
jgi:predicted HNH restriction endonuclease